MRAIDSKFYINAALVLGGLSLAFIVVLMHVGRVFLGSRNNAIQYFRPFATSAVPALLVICSLALGMTASVSFIIKASL